MPLLAVEADGTPRLLHMAESGTVLRLILFGSEEATMIKALLTPLLLGLATAMIIRIVAARRA
jgi:hypothetical protein